MVIIRLILGKLILLFNWVFTPRGIKRDTDAQAATDAQTAGLILCQCEACPFCVKVRRAMKLQSLTIETRDAKRPQSAREELLTGGGDRKKSPACGLRMPKVRLNGCMNFPVSSVISVKGLLCHLL